MATFEVKVYHAQVEAHPNADALDLAIIGGYRAVVAKGSCVPGDLVAYIPEQSIVPDWLIERLGLTGRLAGKAKNRVKAIKLRGVLSQGLVVPMTRLGGSDPEQLFVYTDENNTPMSVKVGMDIAEFLGITKYVPEIPTHMAGEVEDFTGYTLKYDVENLKKYPDVLRIGEEVVVTEKLHGTWACWGYHDAVGYVITSKGLSGRGLAFKQNEANKNNLYIRTLTETSDRDGLTALHRARELFVNQNVYLLGEIFGGNVQDLKYGTSTPSFRLFDVYLSGPDSFGYVDDRVLDQVADAIGVARVPVLWRGQYTSTTADEFTNGNETVSGTESCIREGVVIRPIVERRDLVIGRVQLKSVSEKYLLRKGGTEFN